MNEHTEKLCPVCNGSGSDSRFGSPCFCQTCDGTGIVTIKHSRQTYVEGKGIVYCSKRESRSFKCPRHPDGYKFPGKNKCEGCVYARYLG